VIAEINTVDEANQRQTSSIRTKNKADAADQREFDRGVAECNNDAQACSRDLPASYQSWLQHKQEQKAQGLRQRALKSGDSVRDQLAGETAVEFGQLVLTVVPALEASTAGKPAAVLSDGPPSIIRTGAGEDVLDATIVREIQHGERLADILSEVQARTAGGTEHAVVSLADGRRAIVSGGVDGIDFRGLDLRRLLLHSHGPGSVPGASPEDYAMIDEYFQRSSWLLEVQGSDSATLSRFQVCKPK
jgi:hypothetical protein